MVGGGRIRAYQYLERLFTRLRGEAFGLDARQRSRPMTEKTKRISSLRNASWKAVEGSGLRARLTSVANLHCLARLIAVAFPHYTGCRCLGMPIGDGAAHCASDSPQTKPA